MIKIYIGELIPEIPYTEILYPNLGNTERETPFGENIFKEFTTPIVEIMKNVSQADYLCIPHNYNYVKTRHEYLAKFIELAESLNKKIIIFFPGDSDEEIQIPHAVIFRNSQYRYKLKDNEIIMPAYAVDLGKKYGLLERRKVDKAVIGFCGWASYTTLREWVSYGLFNLMESLVGHPVRKKGLYFRRLALAIFKKSQLIETHFIIRSSYSGNSKTLSIDPAVARKEYIEVIKNSDFTLAPKGDGNFSIRFFEALSLGRIPLLIDTDCPLPHEDEINYDEIILRVDQSKIKDLPKIIAHFYSTMTPEAYLVRQKKCREVFEKYLRIDVFFRQTLTKEFLL